MFVRGFGDGNVQVCVFVCDDVVVVAIKEQQGHIPHICHRRADGVRVNFFLAGVNFYRFNAKK